MVRVFAVGLLAIVGCSSGEGTGSGPAGSSGTSSTGTPGCQFTGTLSGGVSGSIDANGCGTSTGAGFSVAQADIVKGTSLGVRFALKTALRGGELGAQPLERLEIFQIETKGSPELVWSSTSCTLELDKNESAPTTVFKNRFELAGRGSCAGPLEPKAPNTRAAIAVTPFEFRAFINP